MRTSWVLVVLHVKLIIQCVHCEKEKQTVYLPPYHPNAEFSTIKNHHDFVELLLNHDKQKQEAYNFAKAKGWIRFPEKMRKELTELNYTAYPFMDELLKFHPDNQNQEKVNKKFYYMDDKRSFNRKALRQFKLRYNRMMYSIHPTDRVTKKEHDMSEEIRNPVKFMKEKLVKMDRAIDYIDVQVLKEKMTTPEDFAKMKERAEVIRKRIFGIENNGTERYTPPAPRTLKPTRLTVRPLKGHKLMMFRKFFPDFFVDVNITTPSSLEVVKPATSSEE
uniref:Uncharacterized protein n=1 Tax=Cacopsylla melanoneura TaxID=428564 RepID=A0A8D8XRV4_9HEMI